MRRSKITAALAAAVWLWVTGCGAPPDEPLPLGNDAESCGSCHVDHYEQWATSPHAAAARSPLLLAMLPEVEAEWGVIARETCEGCHAPEHGDDEAIGCVSCHAAVGNHAERDGLLAVDLDRPIAGPFGDAQATVAHGSRRGEFLQTSGLCGTCHEITGPNIVDEPTLSEHRASPQASEGIGCMDCHLADDGERPLTAASELSRPVSSHRFVGFDPQWDASPEDAAAAAERTREMLASALSLRLEPADGGVTVVVTNVGAGHSVPTGATFLRDLWVDLEREGVVVAERVLRLGDQPMDGDTPVPLLTRADHVEAGSLAAGETTRVFVATDGPVSAHLRGRAVRDEVLEALQLTQLRRQIPTHEIAEAR